jgi:hypothetical protein
MKRRKVLLAEINEITWDLIEPWMEEGRLPTFARLRREGAWGAPLSVDLPPQLDPWITWTTVYTGRTQAEHNVFFLQQPPESIRAARLWELCRERGLKVGVYGSLCSWPPQAVEGFYVPDTFAPDAATHPPELRPIQELNLTYTRSVRLPSDQDGVMFKAKLGAKLFGLGLSAGTAARVAAQLARERFDPSSRWRRVALQPFVNFDFFSRLYRRHRPDFASFHTNHVAHYMHTYWKAMRPELFAAATSEEERRAHGGAIEHGYRTADELLRRMTALLDDETVLVVASSMGQKPFTARERKRIAQVRSLERLLKILGVEGRAEALSTMSDQFNIYPDTDETRALVVERLGAAYVGTPARPMFYVTTVERGVTVNLRLDEEVEEGARCFFPHAGESFLYEDLVYHTGQVKSGCHDPRGVLILYGAGVRRGARVGECDNLDLAPTLLALLGLPAAEGMTGRVLAEAFEGEPAAATPRDAALVS